MDSPNNLLAVAHSWYGFLIFCTLIKELIVSVKILVHSRGYKSICVIYKTMTEFS